MRFPFLSLVAGATEDRLAPAGLSHRAPAVACGFVVANFAKGVVVKLSSQSRRGGRHAS